ncbi:bromodomain-containing protein homolog [Halyomorpha halys]|uniref:bromodomain-containing protein homolog n=1 Tax=Halyomorpha halys TaxID=286706 RepID=UPI0006D50574|nr:peregrin-like [Halyomorpha halys]
MPSRSYRNGSRRKLNNTNYTTKLLAKESIPIIDRALYNQVYPTGSTSKPQIQYGLTETELNNLPKPNYRIIPDYFIHDMPNKPDHYILFKQSTLDEIDSKVEYDMDDEDVAWLGLLNEKRNLINMSSVDTKIFEFLIDRFEKESRFERKTFFEGKQIEEISDDEAVCYICTGGMSYVSNEILFCDMCNVAVHQECYGVPYVPEGEWLCRRCFHSPSQLLCCVLCPKASGAFKQTDRGFWCHILCAIWIPEVQFSNSIFLDPICCIERIPSSRWNLVCSICKSKDIGACVRCKYRTCSVAFHATCAQQKGYAMMMKMNSSGYKKQRVHGIYCPKHTPKKESKSDCENTNNMNTLKSQVAKSLCSNVVLVPQIPPDKIKEISDLVDFERKNIFIRKLLAYWALKRHLRKGVPMIPSNTSRLEQEPIKVTNSDTPKKDINTKVEVSVVQGEENKKDGETRKKKKYQELRRFRQDLEKVRILCELIRKREKLKNELALVKYKCLELQFAPLIIYLRKFTENLIKLDTDNLFSKAVDGSEAVSAKPTDFVQIRSKVDNFQYSSLEEYENDFQAMISSRITCYAKRTKIYKSATKLKENSKEKFLMAYKDVADLNKMNIEQNEESENDLPEPLSPQIKSEPYENPSASEFATEIDYYGDDPGPSTSSYNPTTNKRKYEENCNPDQSIYNLKNTIKEEPVEISQIQTNVEKSKKKYQKAKTRKKRALTKEEDSCNESLGGNSFSNSSPPQPKVNRRTAILFTKNKTKPRYKQSPTPTPVPYVKQENIYTFEDSD